jgi:hypothetical protein
MNESKLIDKVKNYLKSSSIPYQENTIEFCGIKKKFPINNEIKDMYFVSFSSQVSKDIPYTSSYFIFIDIKTEKLELLLGPQYQKVIED